MLSLNFTSCETGQCFLDQLGSLHQHSCCLWDSRTAGTSFRFDLAGLSLIILGFHMFYSADNSTLTRQTIQIQTLFVICCCQFMCGRFCYSNCYKCLHSTAFSLRYLTGRIFIFCCTLISHTAFVFIGSVQLAFQVILLWKSMRCPFISIR